MTPFELFAFLGMPLILLGVCLGVYRATAPAGRKRS